MKRKIIEIDEAKCDGCGQCVDACHEGALALIDGKARLVKDIFCDGLGACIGECPTGALKIIEREAPAFDASAVEAAQRSGPGAAHPPAHHGHGHGGGGCPGAALRSLEQAPGPSESDSPDQPPPSALGHWPVQLMLVPPHAPFLKGADLVVCADCVPFTVPDFHARYLQGRAVVVGCPKLDDLEHYFQKLAAMIREARPRRLTVLRMEVPCCRGISQAAIQAALASTESFPVEEHVIGVRGGIERNVVRS
ncbi:MAG: 4Fe-4S binding protein [Deltaproteobacteria bacterium]|nr:4Fe-4S binding protein [Deltaproteobacteria bacterium]